jgi:hypothetical protein
MRSTTSDQAEDGVSAPPPKTEEEKTPPSGGDIAGVEETEPAANGDGATEAHGPGNDNSSGNKKKSEAVETSDADGQPATKRRKGDEISIPTALEGSQPSTSTATPDGEDKLKEAEDIMKSIIEKQRELQEAKEKAQKRLNEVRSRYHTGNWRGRKGKDAYS